MRRLVVLLFAAIATGVLAASADAKLTAAEQRWAKPMIDVWNQQNLALHVVRDDDEVWRLDRVHHRSKQFAIELAQEALGRVHGLR